MSAPLANARPRIGLIWAQARGGVIGQGGTMPWHLPEDLKHFSRTTAGSPVVMGRRTWESFPPRFRPLPGRSNIVITSDDAFAADGAVRARSLDEALELAAEAPRSGDTLWVIGGGRVYREAMDRAELLVVTEIDLEVEGDTTAPGIPSDFAADGPIAEVSDAAGPGAESAHNTADGPDADGWLTSRTGLRFRVLRYTR